MSDDSAAGPQEQGMVHVDAFNAAMAEVVRLEAQRDALQAEVASTRLQLAAARGALRFYAATENYQTMAATINGQQMSMAFIHESNPGELARTMLEIVLRDEK